MSERAPTRYDEEGKSLPERGSGRPALEAALSSQVDATPGEPEKLVIPAQNVMWLLMQAFKTEAGDGWMRGFITAHGEPSWILNNQWGIKAGDAEIVKAERPDRPVIGTNGTVR